MTIEFIQSLTAAVFISASASLLGAFVIIRRMALVGDALSHVALPGMAIGLLFNFNPFWGAAAFLIAAVFGIWLLEFYSKLSLDTLVGIFFTSSLAFGVLIAPEHELLETLFGDIKALTLAETLTAVVFSIILIAGLLLTKRKLVLNMLSPELSQASGVNNKALELVFLLIFALAVALGIKFAGALLMGSLVIIPAASAKNVTKSLSSFMAISLVFGVFAAIFGTFVTFNYSLAPGPVFVLISVAIFITSLFARRLKLV